MGNMGATTVWPLQAMDSSNSTTVAVMDMSGSRLLLRTEVFNPGFTQVELIWGDLSMDPNDPWLWNNTTDSAIFDPHLKDPNVEFNCIAAGTALHGAVRYAQCYFTC